MLGQETRTQTSIGGKAQTVAVGAEILANGTDEAQGPPGPGQPVVPGRAIPHDLRWFQRTQGAEKMSNVGDGKKPVLDVTLLEEGLKVRGHAPRSIGQGFQV